jgi:hypothetical protein
MNRSLEGRQDCCPLRPSTARVLDTQSAPVSAEVVPDGGTWHERKLPILITVSPESYMDRFSRRCFHFFVRSELVVRRARKHRERSPSLRLLRAGWCNTFLPDGRTPQAGRWVADHKLTCTATGTGDDGDQPAKAIDATDARRGQRHRLQAKDSSITSEWQSPVCALYQPHTARR